MLHYFILVLFFFPSLSVSVLMCVFLFPSVCVWCVFVGAQAFIEANKQDSKLNDKRTQGACWLSLQG